jgi:hypothetical protein
MTIPEKKPLVSDAGAWAMNVLSSVGIIMANKQVMSATGYDFRYGKNMKCLQQRGVGGCPLIS